MKAALTSIRPQHVYNILTLKKLWEIRKRFPSDYVGWVYIYCTKDGKQLVDCPQWVENELCHQFWYDKNIALLENSQMLLNGKVVARFWCDKVEEHKDFGMFPYRDLRFNKATCLSGEDLEDYGFVEGKGYVPLYAIHITKLEIFDKPKDISEFYKLGAWKVYEEQLDSSYIKRTEQEIMKSLGQALTRAPQSWCYVEI